jgi:signal transduction histidine kinase
MDEHGRSRARSADWFAPDQRQAVLDFWRIYESNYVFVFGKSTAALHQKADFARTFGAEPEVTKRRAVWRASIQAGVDGDWTEYEAYLRKQAQTYATHGVSFSEWFSISEALGDTLMTLIVRYLASTPDRMLGALRAMHCFLHRSMDIIGREFLEVKEAALFASEKQLRALAGRLESAREDERKRISREIHDQLGQQLTSLKLDIGWLSRRRPRTPDTEDVGERLGAISSLLDATVTTVRRLATELRPGVLDDLGLDDALDWQGRDFAQRSGIAVTLETSEAAAPVGDDQATTLFRCFQEILTNVVRHANARNVTARLVREDGFISLAVTDDGRGITPEEATKMSSLGLVGMRERAMLLGGTFQIAGKPAEGTTVTIRLPNRAHPVVGPA